MKTRIFLFVGLLLLGCTWGRSQGNSAGEPLTHEGTINLRCSPDLYDLTIKWAEEYSRLNPKMTIKVMKTPVTGIAGELQAGTDLGFFSNGADPAHPLESDWKMVVGRTVIVPVMNAKNPFLEDIMKKGISPAAFARFFANPEMQTWGTLLGNGQNVPVHCYIVNDAIIKSGIADFAKVSPDAINTMIVENEADMKAAIQKDPGAIGFCRIVSITNANNQNLAENIKLLPIDKNGNGSIDYMEDIYGSLQSFSRGVWIGKYPKALSGNIYAVSSVQPTNINETAFLTWVLLDGQKFLNQQGFSDLINSERQMQLGKLNYIPNVASANSYNWYDLLKLVLLIILAVGILGLIVDFTSRAMKNKTLQAPDATSGFPHIFDEGSVIIPKGLYFDKTHTWAFMEKDGSVKIGIDDFLQHITGPLSGIGMKPAGVKIKKGEPLLTIIQKGKHLLIYSPVSGTITAFNKTLITNTSILNSDPYSDGWVYMIEPTNWLRDIQFLTMADKYKIWIKDEFSRFKDFFAMALNAHTPEYAHVVMQDGGAMADGILADLDPKVWEDFQTKFIDTAK